MKLERISHDKFFKRMMSDRRVAKDFFTIHLPDAIKNNILLDTLKIESTSFISKDLAHHESDMLYQVQLKDTRKAYLYLLVEHQSNVDELMSFRLMRYIVKIIDRHLQQNKNELPLPIVFPMVFYNGKKPYTISRELLPLFGENEEMARNIFLKPFTLIDVSRIDDEDMRKHQWAGILEWCMRHCYEREIIQFLNTLGDLFRLLNVKKQDDSVVSVVKYVISSMETTEQRQQFLSALHDVMRPNEEQNMATIAEVFYNEGVQEGKEQGMQQGMQQGMEQGVYNAMQAMELILAGVELEQIANKTNLSLDVLRLMREKITH